MLSPADFFTLSDPLTASLFATYQYVWELIPAISDHVARLTNGEQIIEGEVMEGAVLGDRPLYIGPGARIEPGAYIQGPAYIAAGAVVRHGGFIRENVIMLPGAICGHASEIKNSVLLANAHAPHFNYIGDSILGNHVNLGAGTKLSNLAVTSIKDAKTGKRPTIHLHIDGNDYDTGLAKFGAILGDHAQTGCNSVLNPGSVIGMNSLIYANTSVRRGVYPPNSIVKLRQTVEVAPRR